MKKLKRSVRNGVAMVLVFSNVGCDQVTKNIARHELNYGESIDVVSNYLTLIKVENTGAFLSFGDDFPWALRMFLLIVLPTLTLLGGMGFILVKKKLAANLAFPLAFILGGGIGNLIDRIAYGSVTDFLYLDAQIAQTGIFNLADVSIVVGTLWLAFTLLKKEFHYSRIEST